MNSKTDELKPPEKWTPHPHPLPTTRDLNALGKAEQVVQSPSQYLCLHLPFCSVLRIT